jgi:hypothetical protein
VSYFFWKSSSESESILITVDGVRLAGAALVATEGVDGVRFANFDFGAAALVAGDGTTDDGAVTARISSSSSSTDRRARLLTLPDDDDDLIMVCTSSTLIPIQTRQQHNEFHLFPLLSE